MNREQKAAVVEELAEQIRAAETIFAVDYRGISVDEAAALRARLRDADTRFRIVKNSLTERATDAAGVESLKQLLEGPTALAFVAGDAALAAKALNDAARSLGTLEFKGGLMGGAPLSADDIRSIARLPARDVLNSQLVGTIAAPLTGLVRGLNALIAGVAVQLQQLAEQKAESSPPSEAQRASETDGEAAASGASASDADETPPEPSTEATAEPETNADGEAGEAAADESPPEPEAEAAAEPEAEPEAGEPEPEATSESEDGSASEALAPEAEADQSDSEAHSASEADASAGEPEPEAASEGESSEA